MALRWMGALLRRAAAPMAIAVGLGSTSYVLSASNTVPATRAGAGAQVVSGYVVSNVHYNLNASDPRNVDSVTFDLDAAPPLGATMRTKVQSTAGASWYACTASGAAVTCPTTSPQVTAASADELTVVIGQ